VIVLRVLGRVLLVCFGASLTAVLLSMAGWWMVGIFTSVGFGFLGMSLGEGLLQDRRASTRIAALAGLLIVMSSSLVSLVTVEQRLWPSRASGLTLEEAHADFSATSFGFRSGRVRPELGGQAQVLGRFGSPIDTVSVVPVVEETWKPDEPILVWAVARSKTRPERSQLWSQPVRVGVRVSGFYVSDYQEAAQAAGRMHKLRVGRDPLFIEWTPTPDASLAAAWRALGTPVLTATAVLFVLILLMRVFQPGRR
jgi:hypothetical protein